MIMMIMMSMVFISSMVSMMSMMSMMSIWIDDSDDDGNGDGNAEGDGSEKYSTTILPPLFPHGYKGDEMITYRIIYLHVQEH